MANGPAVRKSGRSRVPTQKITTDAFKALNDLLSDSEDENRRLETAESKGDDEFPAENALVEDPESDSSGSDHGGNPLDGSEVETPKSPFQVAASYSGSSHSDTDPDPKGRSKNPAKRKDTRSRGLGDHWPRVARTDHRIDVLAGPGLDDINCIIAASNRWEADYVLPRRTNLGMPFAHEASQRDMEANEGWDWYYKDGGRERFARMQALHDLSEQDALHYLPERENNCRDFLFGPYGRQKCFQLQHLQTMNLDDSWAASCADADTDLSINDEQSRKKHKKHGYMLNIGGRVTCLDWAPNRVDGPQYLILGCSRSPVSLPVELSKAASVYTPGPSDKSCLQLWAFATGQELDGTNLMHLSEAPKVRQVICTDWGNAKQLKWCPIPRNFRGEDAHGHISLGLLAGIWGDGFARVLDMALKDSSEGIQYLKMGSAAFASRPPDTVCTCLCWLSPTDLAIGHANGNIMIYDIFPQPKSSTQGDTTLDSSYPRSYKTIAPLPYPSPVLVLTPAYPSHPALLAVSYLSGFQRLLSLAAPEIDSVLSTRTRTAPTTIAYSPHILSMLFSEEASESIRVNPLRIWGNGLPIGKTGVDQGAGSGVGMVGRGCLDTGKVHPSVAWGLPDGRVVVSNPMKKLLGGHKVDGWQLTIFKHEWARRPEPSDQAPQPDEMEIDIEGDRDPASLRDPVAETLPRPEAEPRVGISRITEGYKPERVHIGFIRDKGLTTTIFEEETGVTALSWNPNLPCGGWLAVGWGSGLVRVEDVAI